MPETSATEQFHNETLPALSGIARLWFEDFYKLVLQCQGSLAELEQKTGGQFVRDVLQKCWQFFVESRIKDTDIFKARVGKIAVDADRIILEDKDGQLFRWPVTFSDMPLDTFDEYDAARLHAEAEVDEKIRPKVIKAVLRRSTGYKTHPVVRHWIEHNEDTIAVLRSAGVPWNDPRIKRAEKHLLKTAGRQSLRAAKRPYSNDAVVARREDELTKAKPIYDEWRKSFIRQKSTYRGRKHKRSPEEREQYVIAKFIPSGYNNGLAPNYDATLQSGIEKLIETLEAERNNLEEDKHFTLEKIIQARLQEEFPHVSLANTRRGRQRMKQNRGHQKQGCPSCGSDSKLLHNEDCPAYKKWEASWKKEQAEQDRQRMSKKS